MAQLYCTGPAHIFVAGASFAGPSQPVYLGTCEESPDIELNPEYEAVKNTVAGTKKPLDLSFEGEDALGSLDLTRYNEPVYAILANRPRMFGAPPGAARGRNFATDRGTLMQTEGFQLTLWILFAFGAAGAGSKATMVAGGMPPGYRFPCSVPWAPEKLGPLGTKARRLHLAFYAWSLWNPLTQNHLLYDTNMTGLPAIN